MPRKREHVDAASKVAASRLKRGVRQVNVELSPSAAEALDRLAPGRGQIKPLIERLLLEAVKSAG